MRRGYAARTSSLTSLLDVLFIVAFASLAQAKARMALEVAEAEAAAETDTEAEAVAETEAAAETETETETEAGAETETETETESDGGTAGGDVAGGLYETALAELAEANRDRPAIVVDIDGSGTATAVRRRGDDASIVAIDVPLLAAHPDPDVALVYRGALLPTARLCTVARLALGEASVEGALIIAAPAVPMASLPVALVRGLRREPDDCLRDERAFAVVVDPSLLDPEADIELQENRP